MHVCPLRCSSLALLDLAMSGSSSSSALPVVTVAECASAQVAAEGAKPQPQPRSAPSVELPLITASREELSAMPVKDLKKILAERGIGCVPETQQHPVALQHSWLPVMHC